MNKYKVYMINGNTAIVNADEYIYHVDELIFRMKTDINEFIANKDREYLGHIIARFRRECVAGFVIEEKEKL